MNSISSCVAGSHTPISRILSPYREEPREPELAAVRSALRESPCFKSTTGAPVVNAPNQRPPRGKTRKRHPRESLTLPHRVCLSLTTYSSSPEVRRFFILALLVMECSSPSPARREQTTAEQTTTAASARVDGTTWFRFLVSRYYAGSSRKMPQLFV